MTEDVPRTVKRVPLALSVVIVLLLLCSAGAVVWQLSTSVKPLGPVFETQFLENKNYLMPWTGIPQLDRTLKAVHLVFTRYFLLHPIHFWFLEVWMMPCMALIFFQSIDFDRLSMRLVPIYVFIYQYGAIGIFWPLALIYYLYRRNAHSGRFPGGSTPARVIISGISAMTTVVILSSLSTVDPKGSIFFWLVNAFLLVPCILPLFTWLISSETAPRSVLASAQGQRYENLMYAFFAGISFLLYYRGLPALIETYGQSFWEAQSQADLWAAALNVYGHFHANSVQTFLLFDCLASIVVVSCFILMDGGIIAALCTLLASPIVSPGTAVSIYLLRRESIIYGTATGNWSTKIGTPPSATKKTQ